ncbi:hypothetical protein NKG94_10945 [Micromonospora sp. M12]
MTGVLLGGQPDPLDRAATADDGALALLTGLAANRSFETGQPVRVADLLTPLTHRRGAQPRADVRPHRPAPASRTRPACAGRELYALAAEQPIISPHGHVDPALLAEDRPSRTRRSCSSCPTTT